MIPPQLQTQGVAQTSGIVGTIHGIYKVAGNKLAKIVTAEGSTVLVDLAFIPEGEDWVKQRVGRTAHVRVITRELGTGKKP